MHQNSVWNDNTEQTFGDTVHLYLKTLSENPVGNESELFQN